MSIIPYKRSFASHEKSKYWNTEKNNGIIPRNVFKSTNTKYWFICETCKHSFQSALHNVTKGSWCSFCASRQLCSEKNCKLCYNKSFASHEKSEFWNTEKNNGIKAKDVFKSSDEKYWFDCKDCKHSFQTALYNVTNGYWCSFCASQQLCFEKKCQFCHNKSFASHEKSKYWNYEKNNGIMPRMIFKSSAEKYWFNCEDCKHSFQSILNNVTKGQWCPFCSNPPKQLCFEKDCKLCYEKSFESHEKSKYWNNEKNNGILPRNVFKSANAKYWFDCETCKHSFQTTLSGITSGNHWCPFCSSTQLCTEENCEFCFNKSFASHEKSKFWNFQKNGNKTTRMVFKKSATKYYFDCNECGKLYHASLSNVSIGRWCTCVHNKTEAKLFAILQETFPTIIKQFKAHWCKNEKGTRYLPFDFCIEEHKLIIELDGRQHFIQVSNWSSPDIQFINDKNKEQKANANGFSIIRLLQDDVWLDKNDWQDKLMKTIQLAIDTNEIKNYYIETENNEYGEHKEEA